MMQVVKNFRTIGLSLFAVFVMAACSNDDDATSTPPENIGNCRVKLFDGDHFKDQHIVIDGPGQYSDLSNLPNADGKDWTDEADSFIVGPNTTLTVWTQVDFQGDSTVYHSGSYASVEEPYAIKITCSDSTNNQVMP